MWYAKVRDRGIGPPTTLKGMFEDNLVLGLSFRFSMLERETPEGYNMVIWLEGTNTFIDLAQSIDFDFVKQEDVANED